MHTPFIHVFQDTTNENKIRYYNDLKTEFKKHGMVAENKKKDISSNLTKDFCAYLVEYTAKYHPVEWNLILDNHITILKNNDKLAISHYLTKIVEPLYSKTLEEKIAQVSEQEKKKWETAKQNHEFKKTRNVKLMQENKSTSYTGIFPELLPDWYCEIELAQE